MTWQETLMLGTVFLRNTVIQTKAEFLEKRDFAMVNHSFIIVRIDRSRVPHVRLSLKITQLIERLAANFLGILEGKNAFNCYYGDYISCLFAFG